MRDYDDKRAVYYPPGDLAAGWFTDRVVHVLKRQWLPEQIGVNEAIELHQCKLIVDEHPHFFEAHSLVELRSSLKTNVAFACKAIGSALGDQSIELVFDRVESQYQSQFWDLVAFSGTLSCIVFSYAEQGKPGSGLGRPSEPPFPWHGRRENGGSDSIASYPSV